MINQQMVNEDFAPFILNEKNKWITADFIEKMLLKYQIKFKATNLEEFKKATIHTSYLIKSCDDFVTTKNKVSTIELDKIADPSKAIPLQKEAYERLEFLGDAIIHNILAIYLFTRYKDQAEGFMTRLRTKIEQGETLYLLTKVIKYTKFIK